IHSEYARSNQGSGYWIDGTYRLSQLPFWRGAMRRTELAGRFEQFYSGEITSDDALARGLPGADTGEGQAGVNFYLHDGFKAVGSYGRQYSSAGNVNVWTAGIAYRFVWPLGPAGSR